MSLFSYLSDCSFNVLIFSCCAQWELEWGAGWGISISTPQFVFQPPECFLWTQRPWLLQVRMCVSSLNICQALAKCQLLCTGATFTKTALMAPPPRHTPWRFPCFRTLGLHRGSCSLLCFPYYTHLPQFLPLQCQETLPFNRCYLARPVILLVSLISHALSSSLPTLLTSSYIH